MPETGVNALNGIEEHIVGEHVFTVENQELVISEGMMISIFQPGATSASFHEKSTGPKGEPVSRGCRVKVYNANVVFK